MSYLALARKWRPRSFAQLVGQDHINKALMKSLSHKKLHHAYLFTGTRGVGKTSIARLMAKALNCEQGVSADPCLECDACLAIEQGRFIDLIEIDGASKTRVEDTRDLMENVPYAPTSGRYKIYLIDEVHMLSQHSFNALLKTLEEPPEHVKFLFATTDPQKLPATVVSRCLQFTLKHISIETITAHLQFILQQEQYAFEDSALPLLAKAAQGSMRDALSLLDQAIASAGETLRADDVKNMLGHTRQDYALRLLKALSCHDAGALIASARQIASEGGQFSYVLDGLLEYLHQITVCQLCPDSTGDVCTDIIDLSKQLDTQDVQLFYQIGIKGAEEMHLAPTLATGFEMTMLRMFAFRPAAKLPMPALAHESLTVSPPAILEPFCKTEIDTRDCFAVPATAEQDPVVGNPIARTEKAKDTVSQENWETILLRLKLTGLAQNAAENAELIGIKDRNVFLRIAKGHQSLFTGSVIKRLEQALALYYGETIKINLDYNESVSSTPAQKKHSTQALNQQEAQTSLEQDMFLLQLKEEFSAEVVKNSVIINRSTNQLEYEA